jgi:surface antigen
MRHQKIVASIALCLTVGTVAAAGLGFMSKGPMAKFNDADMKLLNGALEQARSAKEPGTPVEWANEKTGSSGAVTPVRLFEEDGRPCRELKVLNRHKQLESSGIYTMCQQKDGRWQWKQ